MRRSERAIFSEVIWRYGLSVTTVGIALVLTLLLWPWVEPQKTPLFLAAVAVTAWRGGMLPSLLATVLAVLTVDYFFKPLRRRWPPNESNFMLNKITKPAPSREITIACSR